MRHLIWSFFERFFPRLSTAVITLILAAFLNPASIGLYSWIIIGLTLYQAATDAAVRQIAVSSVVGRAGVAFLRAYALWSAIAGGLTLLLLIVVLAATFPPDIGLQAWLLLPVLIIPAVTAVRAKYVAYLQLSSSWKLLAGAQLWAALFSFALSVPLLFATHSLIATAVQLACTETWFTVQVMVAARRRGWQAYADSLPVGSSPARDFRQVSAYSVLGWLQGQGDRLLLALLAGPAVLGLYALAWSLSRSVGDSVSNSTANVLRPVVVRSPPLGKAEIARNADRVLFRSIFMSALIIVATSIAAKSVLPLFLSAEWDRALALVPVMSLSIIPTLLSWSMTVILMATDSLRWAAPIKGVGVVLSVVVAMAALVSLELAAWILVARETLVLFLMLIVGRGAIPRRAVAFGLLLLAVLSAASPLLTWLTRQ